MRPTILTLFLSVVICCNSIGQQSVHVRTSKFSGRIVVFFGPNQTEYDSLAKEENSGIDEILNDFRFYAHKVQPFLKAHSIKSTLTNADIIKIVWLKKTITFERHKGAHIVGIVLSDSIHSPRVIFGVDTDAGLRQTFSEYFKIR